MSCRYKLIIVDDEYLVRTGLRQTVDWQSMDIEVVAECENGAEALDAVYRLRPDLIVSDVRMPVMDGLELAQRLYDDGWDGAIIFYSGYSDFEYVRKALESGVSGYVLKPIENEKLIEKIKETLAALEAKRKKNEALSSLASGIMHVKDMYFFRLSEGEDDKSLRDQLAVLNVVIPEKGLVVYGKSLRIGDEKLSAVYDGLSEALVNFGVTGYLWEDKFILVTGLQDREALCACAQRLLDSNGVQAAIGVSSAFGCGNFIYQAAVQAKRRATPTLALAGVYAEDEYTAADEKRPKKIVDEVLALIYEHYAEKITVKWCADKLFVSESHIMHEFKERVGKTFNDCLKGYRIAKAKEFLKSGKMRINEVAAAVGFSDVRYFGQIFKEQTGKTPSEYMEIQQDEE